MYQELTLVGNLAKDPALRYMPDGTGVCTLVLAVNDKVKNSSGGYDDHTTWFRVTAWGKQAETVNQYLAKGRQVLVVGRLKSDENGNPRTWTDNSGVTRAGYDVTASTIKFLGKRGDYENAGSGSAGQQPVDEDDDALAF